MNKWWGYKHVNGGYHAKRFFGQQDIDDALESEFVLSVTGVFMAKSRGDALSQVMKKLSHG